MSKPKYSTESYLALAHFDHKTKEGREVLEDQYNHWIWAMEEAKWARGLQWFENASYLAGNHLTRYYYTSDGGFGFQNFGIGQGQDQFDNLVAKVADNRLLRATESVTAMLTANKPMPRVEPNSLLPEDEDAAAISEVVLKLLFEKPLDIPAKLREIANWMAICGTVALEIKYGETDIPIVTPRIVVEEEESEIYEGETILTERIAGEDKEYKRDIQAHVWSAYHLTPDPGATGPEDLSWIMRSSFEDIDVIKTHFDKNEEGYFPENLEGMTSDNASKYILYWWAKIRDILDSPQYYQHGGGLAPVTFYSHGGYAPNQTLLSVMDVKPSLEFPRGRYLVFAGNKLLYAGDGRCYVDDGEGGNKYPHRWHPYAFFHWFKMPGKFWGVPMLSELVPLQKKINAIDVLTQANRQFISIGQWLVPKHSKMREGGTSGIPGEAYTYTDVGRAKPEKVVNPPLPSELLVERAELIQGIDVIASSGVTGDEIAKSAARSGPVLDFLRQDKMRNKGPMLQGFERAIEIAAQNILIEIQANMTEENPDLLRRIQVAAREHSGMSVQTFTGLSIRDHHSVKLDVASELMHSPEAMQQKALEYLQYSGGNVSPQERQAVMKALKMDQFMETNESASMERARRMISRVVSGFMEAAFPMPGIDNATVMAPIFQDEILSDRFLEHPEEVRNALVQLFEIYRDLAAEEAQQAMAMQMAMAQGQPQPAGQ